MAPSWHVLLLMATIPLMLLQIPTAAAAVANIQPLSVTPSISWYGYDGSWSAVSLRVGTPEQWVDVMVNTVSSETWVVGPGGCPGNNSLCTTARGGIFDISNSSTWRDQSFFNLGVDNRFGGSAYANYGLDHLTFGTTGVILNHTIIGSINTTSFMLGMFGLGVVPGNFKDITSLPAISGLVEKNGVIPSHSYGYTAGAKYQQKGVPNSLTLGGVDINRFEPHNTNFNLNPSKLPQAYINSISVVSSESSNNWTTPIQLASISDRISAIIDSSTAYLWLPQSVCDNFARALGLTYNSTIELYTFDNNASQRNTLLNSHLRFTISLSDLSVSSSTVNITLPYEAFDLELTFPNPVLNNTYGASKYYFPIKVAASESQYTIGRVFLQEAYLITDYERNVFRVHQAVHTSDPIGNTSIQAIWRPSDSTFSSPPSVSESEKGLGAGAIAGIVVGVVACIALLAFLAFCIRRRKKQRINKNLAGQGKPVVIDQSHGGNPSAIKVNEAAGSNAYATEVGADAEHERFELPAPLGPHELDSEAGTLSGTTENGSSTQDSHNISAYERARRKLERQQGGGGHRPMSGEEYPIEKSEHDISSSGGHFRGLEVPGSEGHTPLVSPIGEYHGERTGAQPSPVSPGFASMPSSPTSPRFAIIPTSPTSPPPRYRGLDGGNVVYAGRLPGNVQLPMVVPDDGRAGSGGRRGGGESTMITEAGTVGSEGSTLGSQYTENESTASSDLYNDNLPPRTQPSPVSSASPVGTDQGSHSVSAVTTSTDNSNCQAQPSYGSSSSYGQYRTIKEEDESKFLMTDMAQLKGEMQAKTAFEGAKRMRGVDREGGGVGDMVHVPVPAEKRFSFEEGGTL